MRRRVHLLFVIAALICTSPLFAQHNKAKAWNVPDIPFDSVPNFFKLPPSTYFGEGIGVATNSKGHIFVYAIDCRNENELYINELTNWRVQKVTLRPAT